MVAAAMVHHPVPPMPMLIGTVAILNPMEEKNTVLVMETPVGVPAGNKLS